MRAASIVAVIASHTIEWWRPPGPEATIFAGYLGLAGVEAFFSLSGFLIGGILLRAMEGGLGPRALRRFWVRRWMRTVPPYWVLLAGLGWWFAWPDWRSPLFLQFSVPRSAWMPLTPHMWSLVLEEWFYLLVPLLLAVAASVRRGRWVVPVVCAALIVGCSAGRAAVGVQPSAIWGPDPAHMPLLRLDCASWGVLAAWLVRSRAVRAGVAALALGAGGVLLLAAGWVWIAMFQPERLVPWGVFVWGAAWQPLEPAIIELAAALVVLGMYRLLPRGRGVAAGIAGVVARFSYALYLAHVPVIYLARAAGIDDALAGAAGWGNRAIIASLIVGAAMALRFGVELPVLALRDRLAPERGGAPVSPGGASGRG